MVSKTNYIKLLNKQNILLLYLCLIDVLLTFIGITFFKLTETNFMIKFPSTKVVSTGKNKGTVKKDINTEIYKSGKKIPIKALSGGQECAFELCSDLATAGTIRDRSGSKLGWVALDEAMDGLDVESKTFALEAVREMVNGQLLIIDHSTEVKEGFEKVIEVEYDGRNSYIIGES